MRKYRLIKFLFLAVIGCLWVSLSVNTANAAVVFTDMPVVSGYITIPEYDNNGVLYCYHSNWYGTIPKYEGVDMTEATAGGYGYQNNLKFFSKDNPTPGSRAISTALGCILVSNLATTTPIYAAPQDGFAMTGNDTVNQNYNAVEVGNYAIGLFYGGDSGSGESGDGWTANGSSTIVHYNRIEGQNYVIISNKLDNSVTNFSATIARTMYPLYSRRAVVWLEFQEYVAPSGYCGDGICNGTETSTTCIDCLSFYDMTTLQDTYLWFDQSFYNCSINSSCQIKYHFDTSIFSATTDYAKLYYYPNGTTTPQYIGNITPLANHWELGDLTGGSFIASSTATSTEYTYYQIVPCKTFGSGGCWGTSTVGVWFNEPPNYNDIISAIWTATSSTSTDLVDEFNVNAYHLTCSDEQWTGDWWTKLGCYFRYGEVILQHKSIDVLKRSMSATWAALKNMFPFNFANLINTSWKNSSPSTVPSELSFLNMLDSDGNISFDFSPMTGATTTLTFWGANTFKNTGGEFTKIKIISKYIFYGLLILFIYLKGKKVYNELIGNNSQEND